MLTIIAVMGLIIVILAISLIVSRKRSERELTTLKTTMSTLLHEIKNPLTALMFQSEIMKDSLPKKYEEGIEVMDKEILRVATLANESGAFLKDPVGDPQPVKVCALVKSITKSFEQKIKVSCKGMADLTIMFDPDKARSVFENLIKNACESADGKDAHVEIEITQVKNKAVIRVMDRGNGFDKADTDKLFNLNYTTKKQGTGIGLYLSKQFTEAQKGSLCLYQREGGGAVAQVILPVWREK